jgi:hypothetical protein
MRDQDSTKETPRVPCLHPAGYLRLLRALYPSQPKRALTWWERFVDMWRSL